MTPAEVSLLATCETNQNAQGMPQQRAETLRVCRASKLNTLAGIRRKTLILSFSSSARQIPSVTPHTLGFTDHHHNLNICLKQARRLEGNLGVLRWCALSLPLPQICCSPV